LFWKIIAFRGRVHDLAFSEVTVKGEATAPFVHFVLDGRSVWLADYAPEPLANIHSGDEVIVAGHNIGDGLLPPPFVT
jgi:hypothetical protein